MTILRVIIDIEVKEVPSKDTIRQVAKLFKQFGHGVVPESQLHGDDVCTQAIGHLHKSRGDYSCQPCIDAAQDERS